MTDLKIGHQHHVDDDHHHYETYDFRNKIYNIWNVGNEKQNWSDYFKNKLSLLIFVVDSAGPNKFNEAKESIDSCLTHVNLKGVPLVVLAGRTDVSGALPRDRRRRLQELGAVVFRFGKGLLLLAE